MGNKPTIYECLSLEFEIIMLHEKLKTIINNSSIHVEILRKGMIDSVQTEDKKQRIKEIDRILKLTDKEVFDYYYKHNGN